MQLRAKRTRSGKVPDDFREVIDELVERGLNVDAIAEELNRRGLKTVRGKSYTGPTVCAYCNKLGIPLFKGTYEADTQLMKHLEMLRVAGKSSKDIAAGLNEAGFRTIKGKAFTSVTVHNILDRMGKPISRTRPCDHILKEIKMLSDRGYQPKAIVKKLNSTGTTTVTGRRFKVVDVKRYLRMISASSSLDSAERERHELAA
jgi:hypothetical protein